MVNRWGLTVTVAGTPVDLHRIPLPVDISHGRANADSQPDAPTLSMQWAGADFPGSMGDPVELRQALTYGPAVTYDSADIVWDDPGVLWDAGALGDSARFVGTITQLTPVEEYGAVVSWEVRAVGTAARLGAQPIRLDRPAEPDTARIAAIAAAAGVAIVTHGDPGPTLAADAIDRDALAAVHEVAESSAGLFWQAPDGSMHYGTHSHRAAEPRLVLPASTILDGIAWTQDTNTITNHVTVKYGEPQAETTHRDDASIAQAWGNRHADVTTLAADLAAADLLGVLIIDRWAWPRWSAPDVRLPLDTLPPADMYTVQNLDVSTSVLVPIPPIPAPTPAPLTKWVVEGWQEHWAEDGHSMELTLSEFGRYGSQNVRTWEQAAAATWADEAAGSWVDALTVEAA